MQTKRDISVEHANKIEQTDDTETNELISFIEIELVNRNKFVSTMVTKVPLKWSILKLCKFYYFFHKMSFTQLFLNKSIGIFYSGKKLPMDRLISDIEVESPGGSSPNLSPSVLDSLRCRHGSDWP